MKTTLSFKGKCYDSKPKQPFEATGYELFYYAANEQDETGKTDVMVTLDRSQMWNCSELKGSSACYEFNGMENSFIGMLHLLECGRCRVRVLHVYAVNMMNARTGTEIVGDMNVLEMKYIAAVDVPDTLTLPLNTYSIATLKAFLKHHSIKLPKKRNKINLIQCITDVLGQFILVNEI